MRRAWGLLLCLFLALPGLARAGENELGRLFYTPQQRAGLERRREHSAPSAPREQTIRLDGIVLRSDRRSTVWLNGRAVHDRTEAFQADPRSLALPVENGAARRMRVGDSQHVVPAPGVAP